jgi:hypothetical protein
MLGSQTQLPSITGALQVSPHAAGARLTFAHESATAAAGTASATTAAKGAMTRFSILLSLFRVDSRRRRHHYAKCQFGQLCGDLPPVVPRPPLLSRSPVAVIGASFGGCADALDDRALRSAPIRPLTAHTLAEAAIRSAAAIGKRTRYRDGTSSNGPPAAANAIRHLTKGDAETKQAGGAGGTSHVAKYPVPGGLRLV